MKTQRRHELRENDLAHFLQEAGRYIQKNLNWILAGLIIIVVGLTAFRMIRSRSISSLRTAYADIPTLSFNTDEEALASLDRLRQMAASVNDREFQLDALDYRSSISANRMVDAVTGEIKPQFVEEAQSAYQAMLTEHSQNAIAKGRALMGLATVEETMFVQDQALGHKERAKGYLQQIVADERLGNTPLSQLAIERLNALDEVFQVVEFAEAPAGPAPAESTPAESAAPKEAQAEETPTGTGSENSEAEPETPEDASDGLNEQTEPTGNSEAESQEEAP